ncbi:hypothetical protein [Piscinibacter sakaiensis]|uniref:hypothetical protein n=1 Tax=Piscinibacter sakaiensis TaxID=1547922 RepID=UPI003AAD6913
MNRSRHSLPIQDMPDHAFPARSDRHHEPAPMRADRFDRHRAHHREHLCHDIRCQEADREIREVLRRY